MQKNPLQHRILCPPCFASRLLCLFHCFHQVAFMFHMFHRPTSRAKTCVSEDGNLPWRQSVYGPCPIPTWNITYKLRENEQKKKMNNNMANVGDSSFLPLLGTMSSGMCGVYSICHGTSYTIRWETGRRISEQHCVAGDQSLFFTEAIRRTTFFPSLQVTGVH